MATSIFFNGRLISVPGSYSQVDASGLEQVGLGASGIVAVVGTGEGGIPVASLTEPKNFIRFSNPDAGKRTFRTGDLREVIDLLIAPAKDPDILAGAQEIVAMKVNPATQSTATLANANGNATDLTSRDYGAFTGQANIAIATGTNKGKLVTIKFENVTESKDDVGGDNMFTLEYRGGTDGFTTAVALIASGGAITVTGTKTLPGGSASITQMGSTQLLEVVSSSAGDTTQSVTVTGLDAGGVAQEATLLLNGTTFVTSLVTFSKVYGARLSVACAGTVTVRDAPTDTSILTLAPAALKTGMTQLDYGFVNNTTASFAADAATTKNLVIVGKSITGAVQRLKIALTGTTPVVTTGTNWSSIDWVAVGDLEAARTGTLTVTAASASPLVQSTLQKAKDYFNAKQVIIAGPLTRGFIFTMVTSVTGFLLSNLDVTAGAAVTIKDVATGYKADLFAIVDWINANSQYMSAKASSGATGGAPSNTTNPVFLAGGSEGTATFTDWQNALNLLKKVRVNSIVVLTGDPAVHAALDAHCAYMCGIGRSERDGFVGLRNAGLTDIPTKNEIKSQIVNLNTRHIRAVAQAVERFNSTGDRTEYASPFFAAICAGAQAGAPVGTSLTFKYMNVLGFRQDTSWNPVDDSEEMIQSGLLFLENVEGVGRRVVRNITTYRKDNNLAYIEGSVNQAVNFAAFNFRTNMEFLVGKKGFSGTINAGKGIAIGTLGLLVDAGVLVAWRSLAMSLAVDVLEVGVEIAPVIPINFVKNTIHLVTIRQAA